MLWNLDGSVHLSSLRLRVKIDSGYGLKKWVRIGPPAHESLTLTQDVDTIPYALPRKKWTQFDHQYFRCHRKDRN